jgi:hypothetical protein
MKDDCLCGPFTGQHCGTRIDDGYLSINCLRNSTYQYDCPYKPAILRKECGYCEEGDPGSNRCIAPAKRKNFFGF